MAPICILTDLERFPETWSLASGESGSARRVQGFKQFRDQLADADLLILNGAVNIVYRLALYFLCAPSQRKPLIVVDLVLRRPLTPGTRIRVLFKRLLLARVDHFIHYFKDSEGYSRFYGITPAKSSFVPFKPNLRYRFDPKTSPDGEYVLCFGRSQRDYDIFFDAMAALPYPAAIPTPDFDALRVHGSRFTRSLEQLPPTVRLLEDDGSQEAMIRILEGARLVVLPILPTSIGLSGVSVYLNAMLTRKCVILSAGLGVSDGLPKDAALTVAPGQSGPLIERIRQAWEDDGLRLRTADAGHRYALSLGGEPELYDRILTAAMRWYNSRERA